MTPIDLNLLAIMPTRYVAIVIITFGVGCLALAGKAFTEEGLPLTEIYRIRGIVAKIIGVLVGLLGITAILIAVCGFLAIKLF